MRTTLTRRRRGLALTALAVVTSLGLAACSGGVATTEDAEASGSGQPRLVLTYEGGIKVLDASSLEEVGDVALEGFNRLNAFGDGEHVLVSTEGGFRVLAAATSGGEPELTDLTFPAETPGHVVVHGGRTVMFDDATGLIQVVPTDSLGGAGATATALPKAEEITSQSPHHGVAVQLSDGTLVRTVGTSEEREGAIAQDAEGKQLERSKECPGVHGEGVAKDERVVLGCEDGVLVWDGSTFTKHASPDADYGRAGNAYTSDTSPVVVTDYEDDPDKEGVNRSRLGFVDTSGKGSFTVVDMPKGVEYTWRGVGRDSEGGAWVLGTDGGLYPVDVDSQTIGEPVQVTGSWKSPQEWQDPHPALRVDGMTAWVTEPGTQSVHKVDLSTKEVTTAKVGVASNEVALATGA